MGREGGNASHFDEVWKGHAVPATLAGNTKQITFHYNNVVEHVITSAGNNYHNLSFFIIINLLCREGFL